MWLKKHKKQLRIIKEGAGSWEPALNCLKAQECPVPEAVLDQVLTTKGKLTDPALQRELSADTAAVLTQALKSCATTVQDTHSRDIKASVAFLYDSITAMRERGWGWGAISNHISTIAVEGKTYTIKAGSLERYYRMLRQEKQQPAVLTAAAVETVPEPEQSSGLLPEQTDQAIDALFDI